jgi:hypothetical protein
MQPFWAIGEYFDPVTCYSRLTNSDRCLFKRKSAKPAIRAAEKNNWRLLGSSMKLVSMYWKPASPGLAAGDSPKPEKTTNGVVL